jgi:hypothetical protein
MVDVRMWMVAQFCSPEFTYIAASQPLPIWLDAFAAILLLVFNTNPRFYCFSPSAALNFQFTTWSPLQ